jgi:hypothetical protein
MSIFFALDEKEAKETRFDLDGLFEDKRQKDMRQKNIFDQMLKRVYERIRVTNRIKPKEQHIFYQVPMMVWGMSNYNLADCVAYLSTRLLNDGFLVRFVPDNWLFICWKNYVPSYVRSELRKKTGIEVDEHGKILQLPDNLQSGRAVSGGGISAVDAMNGGVVGRGTQSVSGMGDRPEPEYEPVVLPNGRIIQRLKKTKPQFVPTSRYRPRGEMVYGQNRFDKIERKVTFQTQEDKVPMTPFKPLSGSGFDDLEDVNI